MGTKTSVIWKISKPELQKMVDESNSLKEVIAKFGFTHASNYKTLRDRCQQDSIDLGPVKDRSKNDSISRLKDNGFSRIYTTEEMLTENSNCSRGTLKYRLIAEGRLEEECSECGLPPLWKNKRLLLILDHINGINNDNRIENLRLLCPNCNSQTETFAGRKKVIPCIECKKPSSKYGKLGLCRSCAAKFSGSYNAKFSKIPTRETLETLRSTMSCEAIGRQIGVTGNCVKKWEKKLGLI